MKEPRQSHSTKPVALTVLCPGPLKFRLELPLDWSAFKVKFLITKLLAHKSLQPYDLAIVQGLAAVDDSKLISDFPQNQLALTAYLQTEIEAKLERKRKLATQKNQIIADIVADLSTRMKSQVNWAPVLGRGPHSVQLKHAQFVREAAPQNGLIENVLFVLLLIFYVIRQVQITSGMLIGMVAALSIFLLFLRQDRMAQAQEEQRQEAQPAQDIPLEPDQNQNPQRPAAQPQPHQPAPQRQSGNVQIQVQQQREVGNEIQQGQQQNQVQVQREPGQRRDMRRRVLRKAAARVLISGTQLVYCYLCSLFPNWNVRVHLGLHRRVIGRLREQYFER